PAPGLAAGARSRPLGSRRPAARTSTHRNSRSSQPNSRTSPSPSVFCSNTPRPALGHRYRPPGRTSHMTPQHQLVDGIHVPRFLYGTAWKEAETGRLTRLAIDQGFRGIDTANQRVHYHEASVGEALVDLWAEGQIRREDLFLQ